MSVFLLPAILAAVIAAIHSIAGGHEIARPLLRLEALSPTVTLTHYYCWHMATITLSGLSGAYVYAALASDGRVLAVFATLVSGLFCLWGLALLLWKRQRHRNLPQWILFAGLTASGIWALSA
ncbi:MAG: hypothetical protein H0T41_03370 [Rhodobacteraceae bacterium]|nr:hypothetical protein [Paracoccaceae bacterium]